MALFPINWRTQVTKILPPRKRSVSLIDWVFSLVFGLQQSSDAMAAIEADLRFRSKLNSQRMVLQAGLNQILGITGILVETNQSVAYSNYTYNESEGLPPLYSYNESESSSPLYVFNESEPVSPYDFTVKIPLANYTADNIAKVTAEVKKIKVTGKSFNVISY